MEINSTEHLPTICYISIDFFLLIFYYYTMLFFSYCVIYNLICFHFVCFVRFGHKIKNIVFCVLCFSN